MPRSPLDLLLGDCPQDFKLRSQFRQHLFILSLAFPAGGGMSQRSADQLRQRHPALESCSPRLHIVLRSVRQLFHPVGYADGDLPAAHRAEAAILFRLRRRQTKTAFPVAVHVVFSLLREKFNGSIKSLAFLDGTPQPLVGHLDIEKIGLTAQLGRRVGI